MPDTPPEFQLIARHFAPLATDAAGLGLTDDAALLKEQADHELVITADALTAGVHFLEDGAPNLIAAKALRVNLSDLAAKGAVPVGYLMTLALPRSIDDAWLTCFARGLLNDQQEFAIALLGGDTTATPGPLTLSITAIGRVPAGTMLKRSGARPGDHVYVSGTIGDAGAGLALLQGHVAEMSSEAKAQLSGRYWKPTPRLALGQSLRAVASAALDVSDGLLADLGHIAEVSRVRIVVEADLIPVSIALRPLCRDQKGIVRAATAGDDYEIAFTAMSDEAVRDVARQAGVTVTRIGRVEAGAGVILVDGDGRDIPVTHPGFTHF